MSFFDLKQQTISGVKWTSISTLVISIVQFSSIIFLTKFLNPTDFGVLTILIVIIGFSQIFLDMGISNAIIQKQDISDRQLSSLYWLNIFCGFFIFLIVYFSSSLIANFYNQTTLQSLIKYISIIFLIIPFGQQFQILFQKKLFFKSIAIYEIISSIIGLIILCMLLFSNFGILAYIISSIFTVLVRTLLFSIKGFGIYKPSFFFSYKEIKGFINFGLFQIGEKTLNYFSTEIDKLLIGKLLGMELLGYYFLAYQIVILPLSKINPIITRVAFPIFSKIQNDIKLINHYYCQIISILMLINLPSLIGIALIANEFIVIFYGNHWKPSVNIIIILSFVGILKVFANPGGSILLSKGRADIGFYWLLIWLFSTALFVFASIRIFGTLEAVAYSQLICSLSLGWIWHYLIIKFGDIKYIPIIKDVLKMMILTLLMGFCVYLTNFIDIAIIYLLFLKIIIGISSFSIFVYMFDRNKVFLIKSLLK